MKHRYIFILLVFSFLIAGVAQAKDKTIVFVNWTELGTHMGSIPLSVYCIKSNGQEEPMVDLPATGSGDWDWVEGKHKCIGERLKLVPPPGSGFHPYTNVNIPVGVGDLTLGGDFSCDHYSAYVRFMPEDGYDQPSVPHPNVTEANPVRRDGYYNVYQGCSWWWL